MGYKGPGLRESSRSHPGRIPAPPERLGSISGLGNGRRLGLVVDLVPLQVRDALLHPRRLGRPLEVVVEELLHAYRVVLLVDALAQAVVLAVVVEQVNLLAEPPQGQEVLDALVPGDGAVLVV